MKKSWEKLVLEVLDVSKTMRFFPGGGGGATPDPEDEFTS